MPYGLAGGQPGAPGHNTLIAPAGAEQILPGKISVEIEAGAALRIETPGGGGFGSDADSHGERGLSRGETIDDRR